MKQKESYDDDEAGGRSGQLANGLAHSVVAAISRLGVIRCAADLQRLQRRHAIRGRSQSVVKQSPLLEPACAIVARQ
jgi:hypothetical protein